MSVNKTHQVAEIYMKECGKIPRKYTNIINKIVKMWLSSDLIIDEEIKRMKKSPYMKCLAELLEDERKNPI